MQVLRVLENLKFQVVRYLVKLITKRERDAIFFGGNHGKFTGDNSWHLYLWWRQNGSHRCFWITRKKNEYTRLKSQGFEVLHIGTLHYYFNLHVCRIAFFTHSFLDVFADLYLIPSDIQVGYLTHDIAPKRTRHALKNMEISPTDKERSYRETERVDFYISTSEFITRCRSEALNVDPAKFHITGLPRNDILISSNRNVKKRGKTVLYAPTWRNRHTCTELFPFQDFDAYQLVNYLEKNNIKMLIRCHKNDLKFDSVTSKIAGLTGLSMNIVDATHNEAGDANTLLQDVDVLISDYSGIIHDFLLLDRPIIGVLYDYKAFESEYGFFYDLENDFPGKCVSSMQQLLQEISISLEDPLLGKKERTKLRQLIFQDTDGNSCERIFNLVDH